MFHNGFSMYVFILKVHCHVAERQQASPQSLLKNVTKRRTFPSLHKSHQSVLTFDWHCMMCDTVSSCASYFGTAVSFFKHTGLAVSCSDTCFKVHAWGPRVCWVEFVFISICVCCLHLCMFAVMILNCPAAPLLLRFQHILSPLVQI